MEKTEMHMHGTKLAIGALLVGLLIKYGVPSVVGPMSLQDALITVGVLGLIIGTIKHSKCCMAMMGKKRR